MATKISTAVHVLQNTHDFVLARYCFAEDGKELDKDSKRTCRTFVLLIETFDWRRSRCRCRCRRVLLKLPTFCAAFPARSFFSVCVEVKIIIKEEGTLLTVPSAQNIY